MNLAPADRRKRGAAYDLAIAVGILVASGQIRRGSGTWALLGELSLSGTVEPVTGVLPMVATLVAKGYRRIIVPVTNLGEAQLVAGVEAVGAAGLDDAARLVAGPRGRTAKRAERRAPVELSGTRIPDPPTGQTAATALGNALEPVDLADIRGQHHARWALEIALAGGHNLLLVGPPGAGKTLLARSIPSLLPPLSEDEALEVTVIESVAGLLHDGRLTRQRPFRSPHHTASAASLVGGGPLLIPGEATLAHHGVLFLDELAEFDRPTLDALRQPLEEGFVSIARVHGHVLYPARFQLVAAMNPCRCGYATDPDKPCRCPTGDADRYVRRVSGPFLDRLDMQIEMARVPAAELLRGPLPEPSGVVRERIAAARRLALERNGGRPNARLGSSALMRVGQLSGSGDRALSELATTNHLTARQVHRLLRVARTIADLEQRDEVALENVYAAANLRDPQAQLHDQLAA